MLIPLNSVIFSKHKLPSNYDYNCSAKKFASKCIYIKLHSDYQLLLKDLGDWFLTSSAVV